MRNLGRYPCLYTITYWDDCEDKEHTAQGMIYADSLIYAAETLSDFYGDPIKVEIQMFEDGLPELPAELFDQLENYLKERENL